GCFGTDASIVTQCHTFVTDEAADQGDGALPLPRAGEGWGGGASAMGLPKGREPSPAALGTMLRIARGASASPASGRGGSARRAPAPKHKTTRRGASRPGR